MHLPHALAMQLAKLHHVVAIDIDSHATLLRVWTFEYTYIRSQGAFADPRCSKGHLLTFAADPAKYQRG